MPTLTLQWMDHGILLKYGDVRFGLDLALPHGTTLLSHAHSDHTVGLERARHVIATEATVRTFKARGGRPDWHLSIAVHGDTILHDGATITPLDSGHVIGSSMFLIQLDGGPSVLYTGDFNPVDSIVHKGARPVSADVLITEATYGSPEWVFPDRREVHTKIVQTARETIESGLIPSFQTYSLGKAQETIALLQSAGIGVVSGNRVIDAVASVYNRYGAELVFTSVHSREAKLMLDAGCSIVTSSPKHTAEALRTIHGVRAARSIEDRLEHFTLSGWALSGSAFGKRGIPLSAHADFPHLMEFAGSVAPRIAYAFTDNAPVLAQHLAEAGIDSVPLQ
ncbi:MAG: hypothetical protein HXY34_03930 [Candidatus Thorarchaeota archaeon]|nr:hypothetical protein [Candidatus Thorarchaeota archaeon]